MKIHVTPTAINKIVFVEANLTYKIVFVEANLKIIYAKFQLYAPYGLRGIDF